MSALDRMGPWSRWAAAHLLPQDSGLCHQEIDPAIRPGLKNPRTALFVAAQRK
ncbi:MAG: hypothetical protein JXB15_10770 [Anaerolineales bacterium]|nr:hypothetical protein [Anaerolineales bacterium]